MNDAKLFPYRRVLLKLSGEALMGDQPFGVDQEACLQVASDLHCLHQTGLELAVVIGGGNIFRGIHLSHRGMPRTVADQMGMLATILNGLAIQNTLAALGTSVSVMSALECPQVVETYQWAKALTLLREGTVVILVGGTGNPYFTTDTAAALRASEMSVDVLMKATKVDGIYNKDPLKYPDAVKYETLSYSQVLVENLGVMDGTAVALCQSNRIPIFVFNMHRLKSEPIEKILTERKRGSWVMDH
jgi:uridylate kinase